MSSPHIGHIPKDFRLDNFLMVLTSDTIMKRFFKVFSAEKTFLETVGEAEKKLKTARLATGPSLGFEKVGRLPP